MIIDRPRCAHGNDEVELCGVGKLSLDIGRQEMVFGHYLMQHDVEPSICQPLSHEPGRADVIMQNQQGAHPPESNLDPND
jgi:hypothetical protein